jgi:hypothetical protein
VDTAAGRSFIELGVSAVDLATSVAATEQGDRAEQLAAEGLPDVIGPQLPIDFECWLNNEEPLFPKVCSLCRFTYSKHSTKCRQQGCRDAYPELSLPTMDAMRKRYGKNDLTMSFRHTNRALQRRSTGSWVHSLNDTGAVETTRLGTASAETASAAVGISERGYFGYASTEEEDTHMFRHTLRSKLANPGLNEVKKELLQEAGELLNLQGFAKAGTDHQLIRQFAYDLTDQGAAFTCKEGVFQNWIHLMGHFHEAKMFMECTMDVFKFLGGIELITIFNGGMTDKQVAWIMRCKSVHIANEFLLECLLSAMWQALGRECAHALKLSHEDVREQTIISWAMDSGGDASFQAATFFLLRILLPYAMIKAGIRTKHFQLYDAGRLMLYPLVFAMNRSNYGPLIARDLILIHYQSTEAIFREITGPLFGYMGRVEGRKDGRLNGDNAEGLDGKVEEDNLRQQKLVSSCTEVGILSAAYLVNIAPNLQRQINQLTNTNACEPQQRTATNFVVDQAAIVDRFIRNGSFRKDVGNGTIYCLDRKTVMRDGFDPMQLVHLGETLMEEYLPNLLAQINAPYPKGINFSRDAEEEALLLSLL